MIFFAIFCDFLIFFVIFWKDVRDFFQYFTPRARLHGFSVRSEIQTALYGLRSLPLLVSCLHEVFQYGLNFQFPFGNFESRNFKLVSQIQNLSHLKALVIRKK